MKWFSRLAFKIKILFFSVLTAIGGYFVQLASCSRQAVVVTAQVASNPTNQFAAVEAASFVANLFYEGPDDPFATPGAGGEVGKLTHVVLRKGEKLFGHAIVKIIGKTEKILNTSRVWKNTQIQQGARAIDKKIGHAEAKSVISAFQGVKPTQQNAERLINEIIEEADAIVIRRVQTKIYMPDGQGLAVETKTGKFIGFVERLMEKEL